MASAKENNHNIRPYNDTAIVPIEGNSHNSGMHQRFQQEHYYFYIVKVSVTIIFNFS